MKFLLILWTMVLASTIVQTQNFDPPDCSTFDKFPIFLNNPINCRAYWYCCSTDAEAIAGFCPDGYNFNEEQQLCDTENDFPCEDPINPTDPPTETTTTFTTVQPPPDCSTFDKFPIFLNNPINCRAYWFCDSADAEAIPNFCPDGYNFNEAQQLCDTENDFPCEDPTNPTDPPTETTTTFTTVQPPPDCSTFDKFPIFLNNPINCRAYWYCGSADAEAIADSCPDGYNFNEEQQLCDTENDFPCEDPTNPTDPPTETTTTFTTVQPPPDCSTFDKFPIFLNNPINCRAYWYCGSADAEAIPDSCPDGYNFNEAQQLCDTENDFPCEDPTNPTDPPTETTTTFTTVQPPPDCSTFDKFPIFLNNPINCRAYWFCDSADAEAIPNFCPDGFNFNEAQQLCDTENDFPCEDPTNPTDPPAETTTTFTTVQPPPDCSTFDKFPIFLNNPINCRAYWYCGSADAEAIADFCPDGFNFNEEQQLCDTENDFPCEDPTNPTDPPTETTTTFTTVQPPPDCSTFDKFPIFLNNPINCRAYWYCGSANAEAIPDSCPDGYNFNEEQQLCDTENDFPCEDPTNPTDPPTETTTTFTTVQPPPDCSTFDKFPMFLNNPMNCRAYWYCGSADAEAIADSCPDGFNFNEEQQLCDTENDFPCEDPTNPTDPPTETTTTFTTVQPPPDCSTFDKFPMFLNNPMNCRAYWYCGSADAEAIADSCPDGFNFNEEQQLCDTENDFPCEDPTNPTDPPTETTTTFTTVQPPPDCSTFDKFPMFLNNPMNCRAYWYCGSADAEAIADSCPDGFNFNEEQQLCDTENDFPCEDPTNPTDPPTETTTTFTTVQPPPDCSTFDKFPMFLNNPMNCRAYWYCGSADAEAIADSCPDGFNFNEEQQLCDTENDFPCEDPTNPTDPPTETTTTFTTVQPPPDCSTFDKFPMFLNNPMNCRAYWYCGSADAEAIADSCPDGFNFNEEQQLCDTENDFPCEN